LNSVAGVKDPKRMSRSLPLALCLLALGSLATGCGTTGADRDDARRATQTLYSAAARHDGTAACAQMSPSLRAELVSSDEGERCARAVLRLDLDGRTPDQVKVYANEALVRLIGGDTVFLSATREGWRVDALGCRPHGKGPYDCEATS
jgi:hypothetical protein